ncbi:MAG: hypothetical protein K9I94_15165 [Bacteroidales bacterium]|nr:hypothetical protein [Bacteroidales bacterium]
MRRIKGITLVLVVLTTLVNAQEQQGIIHSNYAGITKYQYNPADILNERLEADFNLVSGNVFGYNNFLYIDRKSFDFGEIFKQNPQFNKHGNYITYSFEDENLKHGFTDFSILGPSGMIKFGNNAIGLHTAAKGAFSLDDMPYSVAQFSYKGSTFSPLHDSIFDEPEFSMAGLAYVEIGVSYAHEFELNRDELFTAGISVNYLMGMGSLYLHSDELKYLVPSKDSLVVGYFNGELAYSLPVKYSEPDFEYAMNKRLFNGQGLSFNVGFTYQKISMVRERGAINQFTRRYDYKAGLSFTDFGSITMNRNTRKYTFNNSQTQWDGYYDYEFEGLNHMDSIISAIFRPDPAIRSTPKVKTYLPAAFRAYFDYSFENNWFLNTNITLGINQSKYGVKRPNQLGIVPRYETPELEIAFPVSFYDMKQVHYGLAVRIWNITLGTDDIATFFGPEQMSKGGFYFSFKYNILGDRYRSRRKGIFDAF